MSIARSYIRATDTPPSADESADEGEVYHVSSDWWPIAVFPARPGEPSQNYMLSPARPGHGPCEQGRWDGVNFVAEPGGELMEPTHFAALPELPWIIPN